MSSERIYKQGFATDVPVEQAYGEAVSAAVRLCIDEGYRVTGVLAEVIATDAHRAAGEYLVRVQAQREAVT